MPFRPTGVRSDAGAWKWRSQDSLSTSRPRAGIGAGRNFRYREKLWLPIRQFAKF
jgi:hypothetical protein